MIATDYSIWYNNYFAWRVKSHYFRGLKPKKTKSHGKIIRQKERRKEKTSQNTEREKIGEKREEEIIISFSIHWFRIRTTGQIMSRFFYLNTSFIIRAEIISPIAFVTTTK